MPEKLKTYDHFSGLGEAGGLSFFDSNKKYDVVSAGDGILDGINDEPIRKLTKKEEDEFIYHIKEDEEGNPLKQEPKFEEEYSPSEKYFKYQNAKEIAIPVADRFMDKIADTMESEYGVDFIKKNDTIQAPPMPEKIEPIKKENSSVTKPDQHLLSVEDKQLIALVHKEAEFKKKKLSAVSDKKEENERNQRNLKEFTRSPYLWMKADLTNTIGRQEGRLKEEKNAAEQENLKRKLEINKSKLKIIEEALEKELPLNLDRKFNKDEIDLGDGKIFKVEEYKDNLNKYKGLSNGKYEIINVIQRKHGDFIVLKTENGEVELDIEDAMGMIREKEEDTISEKEKVESFNRIHDGSIVRVRIGGKKGEVSSYKMFQPKNGEIFFLSLGNKQRTQLPLEKMKEILFDKATEFIVEEDKKKKKLSTPKEKTAIEPEIKVRPPYVEGPTNFPEPIKLVNSTIENSSSELMDQFKEMLQARMKRKQELQGMRNQLKDLEEALEVQKNKDIEEYNKKIEKE